MFSNKIIADRVFNERRNKNIYQKDLAKHLGITQAAYSFKERNIRHFTYDELKKISQYLNISLNDLLKED